MPLKGTAWHLSLPQSQSRLLMNLNRGWWSHDFFVRIPLRRMGSLKGLHVYSKRRHIFARRGHVRQLRTLTPVEDTCTPGEDTCAR